MVNFTPVMQLALQAQSALLTSRGFIAQAAQATVRLGHTFRF